MGNVLSVAPNPSRLAADAAHGMNDPTTVLYVLTTLAQSCAALAAFVGAVGVFRLQLLRDGQNEAERNLRSMAAGMRMATPETAPWLPIEQLTQDFEKERGKASTNASSLVAVRAIDAWRAFVPFQDRTRRALLVLEAWNLGVIGVSLIGFNYVPMLARAPWFSYALLTVATGTVLIPLWCVWVWTKRVEALAHLAR